MKLSFRILLCSALLAVLGLSSCSAPKNVAYMQDLPSGTVTEAAAYPGILIEPNDLLNIVVTTKEPELGTLFNLQPGIVTAEAIGNSNTFNSNDSERGYRVDAQGNIIFPQLGSLHVEGLTREQLESLIKIEFLKRDCSKTSQ